MVIKPIVFVEFPLPSPSSDLKVPIKSLTNVVDERRYIKSFAFVVDEREPSVWIRKKYLLEPRILIKTQEERKMHLIVLLANTA